MATDLFPIKKYDSLMKAALALAGADAIEARIGSFAGRAGDGGVIDMVPVHRVIGRLRLGACGESRDKAEGYN
jgi:hypothetical protein